MNHSKNKGVVIARIFLFVIYFVGMTAISLSFLKDVFIQLTPYTLLVSALILLVFHRKWDYSNLIVVITIVLAGYFVEVLGVHTGTVFGAYSYGPVLGMKVWSVPLIIALNWLILIYCSYFMALKLFPQALPKIAATAVLMVIMDLLIEPVAIGLTMWTWEDGSPSLQNYGAWFVISLIFAGLLHLMKIEPKNPMAGYLFFYLLMFFGVLNLTL